MVEEVIAAAASSPHYLLFLSPMGSVLSPCLFQGPIRQCARVLLRLKRRQPQRSSVAVGMRVVENGGSDDRGRMGGGGQTGRNKGKRWKAETEEVKVSPRKQQVRGGSSGRSISNERWVWENEWKRGRCAAS